MATMCDACPHTGRKDGAQTCELAKAPILVIVTITKSCPAGRFPDKDGVIKWAGVKWYGLPEPLRWWAVLRIGKQREWPGCGCVKWLKDRAPWLPMGWAPWLRSRLFLPVMRRWHAQIQTRHGKTTTSRRIKPITDWSGWLLSPTFAAYWLYMRAGKRYTRQ
jgi:hypothetical protein